MQGSWVWKGDVMEMALKESNKTEERLEEEERG